MGIFDNFWTFPQNEAAAQMARKMAAEQIRRAKAARDAQRAADDSHDGPTIELRQMVAGGPYELP